VTRWSSSSMRPRFGTIDGVTVRFAQSEPQERQALLFSPWPESVLAYEQAWSQLADHAHLVAIDLPGFGASERREDLLSPAALGEFIITIADAFTMDRPHLVAPSIATPASLFTAARHPERVATVTVGPGPALTPLVVGPDLHQWANATTDVVSDDRGGPRRRVIELLSHIERHELDDEVRDDYLRSYDGDRLAGSRTYWQRVRDELPALQQILPTIEAPIQIIAGRGDRLIPWPNAESLHRCLPSSQLFGIDTGHFVWEDAAAEYAALLSRCWQAWNLR
jgi:pimeloyl-ACP methyl ester carboxylesterase